MFEQIEEENFIEKEMAELISSIRLPGHSSTTNLIDKKRSVTINLDQNREEHFSRLQNTEQIIQKLQIYESNIINKNLETEEKLNNQKISRKHQIDSNKQKKRSFSQFLFIHHNFSKELINYDQKITKEVEAKPKKPTNCKLKKNQIQVTMKSQIPVFQRLYNNKNKSKENLNPNIKKNVKAKSKNRSITVQQYLYKDALRRIENSKQQQLSQVKNITFQIQKNTQNKKYIANKFLRQYLKVLQDLKIELQQESIEYIVYNQILFRLGFILSKTEMENKSSSIERNLVYEGYNQIKPNKVNALNICKFLLAVLGIYDYQFKQSEIAHIKINQNCQQLCYNQQQGKRIHKTFNLLYRNRLVTNTHARTQSEINYPFKPQVNPQSQQIAYKFRNKILEQTTTLLENNQVTYTIPQDGVISHADLLIFTKINKNLELEKKKEENQLKELKQCTFQPKITNHKQNIMSLQSVQMFETKRKQHKTSITINKTLQTQVANECVFFPKTNSQILRKDQKSPINMDKQIIRMLEARKQRNRKNQYLQRGYVPSKLSKKKNKSCSLLEIKHDNSFIRQQKNKLPANDDDDMSMKKRQGLLTQQQRIKTHKKQQRQLTQIHIDTKSKQQFEQLLQKQIESFIKSRMFRTHQ